MHLISVSVGGKKVSKTARGKYPVGLVPCFKRHYFFILGWKKGKGPRSIDDRTSSDRINIFVVSFLLLK